MTIEERTQFWESIRKRYPNSYVLFTNFTMYEGDIISGDIDLVTKDSTVLWERCNELRKKGIEFLWSGTGEYPNILFI